MMAITDIERLHEIASNIAFHKKSEFSDSRRAQMDMDIAVIKSAIAHIASLDQQHDQDIDRLERAADSLDKYRNITERAGRAIDQAATEIESLWHYATCPYDHCERCIREEDIIKGVRDRLAELAVANGQFGVGA